MDTAKYVLIRFSSVRLFPLDLSLFPHEALMSYSSKLVFLHWAVSPKVHTHWTEKKLGWNIFMKLNPLWVVCHIRKRSCINLFEKVCKGWCYGCNFLSEVCNSCIPSCKAEKVVHCLRHPWVYPHVLMGDIFARLASALFRTTPSPLSWMDVVCHLPW